MIQALDLARENAMLKVDRRVGERRRGQNGSPGGERRRSDRRSLQLDSPDALVLSVR